MQGPDQIVLRISNLRIERQDPVTGTTFILDVPEFHIRDCDRIGLVGTSGSGKTTFLEMLGLLIWPSHLERFDFRPRPDGQLLDLVPFIRRRDGSALSEIRSEYMGFIMQDGGLLPYLSVFENAWLAVRLSDRSGNVNRKRIETTAGAMGLAEYLHRMPASLSGGQRQRAAVLRSLAPGACLLLGDEPTAALDSPNSFDVMTLISDSAGSVGASVVLASHNAALLREFGYRIFCVKVEEHPNHRVASLAPEMSG